MKIEKEEGPAVDEPKPKNKPENKPQNAKPKNIKLQDSESERNRTPAMAGLAIAVVLLVGGLWLARELTAASKMQDCLMSGRTNCNVIELQ